MRFNAIALLAIFAFASGVARAECPMRNDHVVLFGTSQDPDVLLWDSRLRLRGYEDGSFDEMNALLPHARLTPPGTRAVVKECVSNYVQQPETSHPDDAVGVLILTGPLRGHYGWIVGSDIRAVFHNVAKKKP